MCCVTGIPCRVQHAIAQQHTSKFASSASLAHTAAPRCVFSIGEKAKNNFFVFCLDEEHTGDDAALYRVAEAKLRAEWERDRVREELDASLKNHAADVDMLRAELAKQHLAQVTMEQQTERLQEELAKVKKAMMRVDADAQADVERLTRERDTAVANLELSQVEVAELQAELDAAKKAQHAPSVRTAAPQDLHQVAAAAQALAASLTSMCAAAQAPPASPADNKRSFENSSSSSSSKKKRRSVAKKAPADEDDDEVIVLQPSPAKPTLQQRALVHITEQCSDENAPKKCKTLLLFAEKMHENQLLIDAGATKLEEKSNVSTAASIANVIVPHDMMSPALRAMLAANGVSAVTAASARSLQEHGRKSGKDAHIILVPSIDGQINMIRLLMCRAQMVALLQGHVVMTFEAFIEQLATFNRERFVYNIDEPTDMHDDFLAQLKQTQSALYWQIAPTPQMFCVYPELPGTNSPRSAESLAVNLVLRDDTLLTSTGRLDNTIVEITTALELMEAIFDQLAEF